MRRVHLFEFEDLSWCPRAIRGGLTDFLAAVARLSDRPFLHFAVRLRQAMEATGDRRIIDLCSGGGGPLASLLRLISGRETGWSALLTDLYPDPVRLAALAEADPRIDWSRASINAMQVPESLRGFRLISNGFHHFRPADAEAILRDAVDKRQGIALLEGTDRSAPALASAFLTPPLLMLLLPTFRPRRPWQWVLTYLLPIIPLVTLWDGFVSCLRVYEPDELAELVGRIEAPDWRWEYGRLPVVGTILHVTWLIGYPTDRR